jgi:hypothetical protein
MAKGIVLCYEDVDQGATANDLILRAKVAFVGPEVPNGPVISRGPDENGLAIAIAINALAQYPNSVEDALLSEATRLGFSITRPDCLFPSYTRGA